jgi:hypothetical protein
VLEYGLIGLGLMLNYDECLDLNLAVKACLYGIEIWSFC